MARRISLSQWKSQMNQAINKYNSAVRKYNSEVNRAITKYNQDVRRHNSAVRSNRQKLANAIAAYNRNAGQKTILTYSVSYDLRTSLDVLNQSYRSLEADVQSHPNSFQRKLLVDYPEQETTNSFLLYNSLQGADEEDFGEEETLQRTLIEQQLSSISPELERRWRGALYSLNPGNPDAARHFCTSVREIFVKVLDLKAPDAEVAQHPNCEFYEGRPNRRSKIRYLMSKKAISFTSFENFMEDDIKNLLDLFRSLNDGTHGQAGTFGVPQLLRLKKRVEDSIMFITSFSN